ncbi:MAG: alanine--tRNA ligase [Candidatus Micrarchaeaceae archaeon]
MKSGSLSKDSLRKEFSKNPSEYYKVALFEEEGFSRHLCRICGKNFWSIKDRDVCDDPEHTEYSFFKEKPKHISYTDFWHDFAKFFKKNGHHEIKRYPVVSRWRQDLYFTIASIQDFQRIENGAMSFEYAANPLIVPQTCLRFSDIENVGVTGRHFTSFMMAGQHSFNYPKEGYFRDRTIELNFKYLTGILGVKKDDLVYSEDVWAMGDFSEFGPCLESFSNGLELVNSVFTQFESVKGEAKELSAKVVDVGWGFERLMWFYSGSDTAYETVFHGILEKLEGKINFEPDSKLFKKFSALSSELDITEKGGKAKELEVIRKAGISAADYQKRIKPMQALYAILDHTRTLLFAITDGALPSNVGGGYNLRIILRRALSFIDEYGFEFGLDDIAELEAKELKPLFPELSENLGLFAKVIEIEANRFSKTRENANKTIDGIISRGKKIAAEELKTLYESNGVTPELIEAAASKRNVRIELPDKSYEDIIKGDFASKEKPKKFEIDITGLPKTEQLYYNLAEESESKVLRSENNLIVIDRSPFYPEGGGQEADHGTINGFNVIDVQKIGDVIIHIMESDFASKKGIIAGMKVKCIVDKERRMRLMVHHTSVHLMSAAARNVIGKHAWQEGTRKSFDKAHIDIAHYDGLNEDDIKKLEEFINSRLFRGITVTVKQLSRKEAEEKYGFSIYQGHGVPAHTIRMVIIEDKNGNLIDAEACGGLHVAGMEQAIGMVKVINTERISDGIDRIELVAGNAALDYFRRIEKELSESSRKLNSDQFAVAERISLIDSENKTMRKRAQEYKELAAQYIAATLSDSNHIEKELDLPRDMLRMIATKVVSLNNAAIILLNNGEGEVICISGGNSNSNALDLIKSRTGKKKFLGGGSARFAEGKII